MLISDIIFLYLYLFRALVFNNDIAIVTQICESIGAGEFDQDVVNLLLGLTSCIGWIKPLGDFASGEPRLGFDDRYNPIVFFAHNSAVFLGC